MKSIMLRSICSNIWRSPAFAWPIVNPNSKIYLKTLATRPLVPIRLKSSSTIPSAKLNSLQVDKANEVIKVHFEDESEKGYPFLWLRDNCRCSECFEKHSGTRSQLLENLDLDIHPLNTDTDSDSQSVIINWSDGHKSEYPVKWLKAFQFPTSTDPLIGITEKYWGSEMTNEKIPRYSFQDIMSDDSSLLSWLRSVYIYGFSIVDNMGDDDKNPMRLTERVSYPRKTCYGRDFIVKSNPEPTNLAYTGMRLCLHTDLAIYRHEPGIQILHCIRKSEYGGSSVFADGFNVAYNLKHEDPETFEILTTVPIIFADQGTHEISNNDFALYDWKPTVRLNRSGRIQYVNFSNHLRGIHMSVPPKDVKKVYRALKKFNSALNNEKNFISLTLQEGEAACFNNTRVLHGRSAFTVPPGCQNPRHLQGIYVDWDEVYGLIRALTAKLT